MKLRNKKTGNVFRVEFLSNWQTDDGTEIGFRVCDTNVVYSYNSLAELNEEWEDCKEPKKDFYIDFDGTYRESPTNLDLEYREEIGNYFETKEEAEKAIEKLKAWKRLKDAGVSFKPTTVGHKWYLEPHASPENRTFKESQDLYKDVMLFFGGEDDKK